MATEVSTDLVERRIRESVAVQERLTDPEVLDAVVAAADLVTAALRQGGKLIAFGNGGSAADATHIAAEFVGRFRLERRALPALSLTDNTSAVSAIANDYGYEQVFSRQIEAVGAPGDVALGISTSGRSPNVLAGLAAAREGGLSTIALSGGDGGPMAAAADVALVVPSSDTARVQEGHILLAHVLCELVEQACA
jgi:D-sedoheptulose 7-phosphate isomerase